MTDRKLIFDVGANDGADTAFYLGLGYSVVAVEADPKLALQLRRRFTEEIVAGLVTVVNVAVTEKDSGEVDLYISAENTESSLIRTMAERSGEPCRQVKVPARNLCSLFEEFGLPWYCKIDIEGYDAMAVKGMSTCEGRPAYISCEAAGRPIAHVGKDEYLLFVALDALAAQGYRQFKLVDQESLVVLADEGYYDRLHSWLVRIKAKWKRWSGRETPGGAAAFSGPFGENLAGEWAGYDVTRGRMQKHFAHYFHYTKNKQFIFWVDIHGKY